MNFKRKNIFFGIPRLVVFLLYVPFFFVQGLLNYPNTLPVSNEHIRSHVKKIPADQQSISVSAWDKAKSKESKIRLNKRFQPQSGQACISATIQVPVFFKELVLLSAYFDMDIPSHCLSAQKLRGPPGIV